MAFAKLAYSKQFKPFGSFQIGEFFQWRGNIYIKINPDHAINLSQEGKLMDFGFNEQVEDVQIELKIL